MVEMISPRVYERIYVFCVRQNDTATSVYYATKVTTIYIFPLGGCRTRVQSVRECL